MELHYPLLIWARKAVEMPLLLHYIAQVACLELGHSSKHRPNFMYFYRFCRYFYSHISMSSKKEKIERNLEFHSLQLRLQTLLFPAHRPFCLLQFLMKTTLITTIRQYWYYFLSIMFFSTKNLNFLAMHKALSQPKPAFISLLRLEGRRHLDKDIPRIGLLYYSDLAFKYLLDSGND
jgi:hypothetical protein